jgi:hypothetical protein
MTVTSSLICPHVRARVSTNPSSTSSGIAQWAEFVGADDSSVQVYLTPMKPADIVAFALELLKAANELEYNSHLGPKIPS